MPRTRRLLSMFGLMASLLDLLGFCLVLLWFSLRRAPETSATCF